MVSILDCIRRTPARINWILEHREQTFAMLQKRFGQDAKTIDELILVGSGTSNTSAVTARFPAQKLAGIRVTVVIPSEFLHEQAVRNPNALYVFISQTGTTTLTRAAQAEARKLGYRTVAVSESAQTLLAQEADAFVDMGCGMEEYPMRTIGYSTSVLTLTLIGLWAGKQNGSLSPAEEIHFLDQCATTAETMPLLIDRALAWMERERRQMMRADCLVFTGSGALAGVAMEAAVKMWEMPQVITLSFELEEGLHAPNFGYTQRHCVVVLNDGGVDDQKAKSLCSYMKNEKQNGFMIGAGTLDEHDLAFDASGDISCLLFAAVVQTISYHLALSQGRDLFAPHDNRVMYSYFYTHDIPGEAACTHEGDGI